MLLLSQLFKDLFTLLLPILNALYRDLFLFNSDLLLKSIKLLILELLLVVQFVHTRRINVVNFITERRNVIHFVICVAYLRLKGM